MCLCPIMCPRVRVRPEARGRCQILWSWNCKQLWALEIKLQPQVPRSGTCVSSSIPHALTCPEFLYMETRYQRLKARDNPSPKVPCRRENTRFILLCPAPFIQHNMFQDHPYCRVFLNFLFLSQIIKMGFCLLRMKFIWA